MAFLVFFLSFLRFSEVPQGFRGFPRVSEGFRKDSLAVPWVSSPLATYLVFRGGALWDQPLVLQVVPLDIVVAGAPWFPKDFN